MERTALGIACTLCRRFADNSFIENQDRGLLMSMSEDEMTSSRAIQHTTAWRFQVWASFVIATLVTSIGIAYLPVELWTKAFLGMGLLFTIGSCFSLAKTVRDDHETTAEARPQQPAHPFRAPAS